MSAPDAGHRRGVGAKVRGQGACAPVGGTTGTLFERDAHHLFHLGCLARRARAPRARDILQQATNAGREKARAPTRRSEEHTSELQSLMRISYAVFCLKKKTNKSNKSHKTITQQAAANHN